MGNTNFKAIDIATYGNDIVAVGEQYNKIYKFSEDDNSWVEISKGSKKDAIALGPDNQIFTTNI